MGATIRAGKTGDVDRCVELWTRVIADRDGVSAGPAVAARAQEAFTRPVVRFAVTGAALVTDAVEHARTAGYQRIELDVRQSNTRAIAVHVRTGFHPGSAPWRVDEGDPVVTWTRQLTNPSPDDATGGVARFGR